MEEGEGEGEGVEVLLHALLTTALDEVNCSAS